MKKFAIVAFVAAPALALAACGGASTTAENTVVSNDVVLNGEDLAVDNIAEIESANAVVDNVLEAAGNEAEVANAAAAGNAH